MKSFLGRAYAPSILAVAFVCASSVALGLVFTRSFALAIAALVVVGILGAVFLWPRVAFAFLLFSGGMPLNFITGGQRSLLSGLGGTTVAGALLTVAVPALMMLFIFRGWVGEGFKRFLVPLSWVVWSAVTLLYTDWPDEGIRVSFKLLYPLIVGVLAYFFCRNAEGVSYARKWWYAGYALTSSYALFRLFTSGLAVYGSGEIYRYSAINHPSPFSFYMLVTFVLALALFIRRRRRLDGFVAVTAAVQVALSMTRISIAALVVAIIMVSLLAGRGLRQRLVGTLAGAVVAAGLLTALLVVPSLQSGVFFNRVTSVQEALTDTENLNTSGRDDAWRVIYDEYRTGDQLIGRGLGSSTRLFKEGKLGAGIGVAHSEYVRVLYEEGWLGAIWFGGILLVSAFYLGLKARKARDLERALLSAACVAVVVYAITSITDNTLDYYNVFGQFVAVLAGAGLGLRASRLTSASPEAAS